MLTLTSINARSVVTRIRDGESETGLNRLLQDVSDLKMYLNDYNSEAYRMFNSRKRFNRKWPILRQEAITAETPVGTELSMLPGVQAGDMGAGNPAAPVVVAAPSKADAAQVAVDELTTALRDGPTELLTNPWVEKQGLNDFLVMKAFENDFSKVIPNDIFYQIEKKCVNWLDKCSINGLSARLLKQLHYPWRR